MAGEGQPRRLGLVAAIEAVHRASRSSLVLVLALTALAAPNVAAADWPVYGHDLSNTRDAGSAGPSAAELGSISQTWSFQSPTGDFTGTPVVAGGAVVAGDNGGTVYALSAVTGKLLWSKDLGQPVTGSAAIDVSAPGGAEVLVPLAEEGAPRLVGLSLRDGAKRWDTVLTNQSNASVFGSPTFWNGTAYIGTSGPNEDNATARGSVVAVNEANGQIRWQTFTVPPGHDGAAVWCTPAIDTATGRLYIGTGNNYHPPTTDTEDAIMALDAASGRILGHYQATASDSFTANDNPAGGPDYDFGASPNLLTGPSGQALVGEGQKSGTYWALDRSTLQPVWHTTVGPGGYLGGILGSTAYDGTRIYGADTLNGSVFSLTRGGEMAWSSPDPGGAHLSATTVAHGVVYTVDPSGFVTARDPASGSIITKLPLNGASFGGVSATGRALYVAVGTGPLPAPAPQQDGSGSIIAFGDTSQSGAQRSPAGTPSAGAGMHRIRLSVSPRRVRAHRRVVLRFRALDGSAPASGVKVSLGRRHVLTDPQGRATMRVRFARPGTHYARASRRGMTRGRAALRVAGR